MNSPHETHAIPRQGRDVDGGSPADPKGRHRRGSRCGRVLLALAAVLLVGGAYVLGVREGRQQGIAFTSEPPAFELGRAGSPATQSALAALRAELAMLSARNELDAALLALEQTSPEAAQVHLWRAAKALRGAASVGDRDQAEPYRTALEAIERAEADTAITGPTLRAHLLKLERQLDALGSGTVQSGSFGPRGY